MRVGGKDAASPSLTAAWWGGREPSAGAKPASPSYLKEFKPILKVQYTIQLNASQGAPRREAPVRAAN